MEKYAPAFTEKNSETVQSCMVIIQYINNKQVKNSNKIIVVIEFLHRLIFYDFHCFSLKDWDYYLVVVGFFFNMVH